jgi:hypothetical protein
MDTSLEQFVKMTAMVHVADKDFSKMYAYFGIDEKRWQAIAMHWMQLIGNDAEMGQRFQAMILAELQRLRSQC